MILHPHAGILLQQELIGGLESLVLLPQIHHLHPQHLVVPPQHHQLLSASSMHPHVVVTNIVQQPPAPPSSDVAIVTLPLLHLGPGGLVVTNSSLLGVQMLVLAVLSRTVLLVSDC